MARHLYGVGLWLLLALLLGTLLPERAAAQAGDWAIPGGRFYTQAAGGQGGFSVTDDAQARFWSEFQRLGGLTTVGYPISQRFVYEGFVTQGFQKLVLQWRPEVGQAWPVNIFDELSENGFDPQLYSFRQTPFPLQNFDPPGATWQQIIANRQALLNANPAIRARYFGMADPLNVFGLPTSAVEDMGNHFAIRTQRAVFQQWKEAVPWASAGEVTIANGGDLAKERGWFQAWAIQPEPQPGQGGSMHWQARELVIGAGQPGPLYLWQQGEEQASRLLKSNDLGETWVPFEGGSPVPDGCLYALAIDSATVDSLYIRSCQGFYHWTGSQWERIAEQGDAVTPGAPQQLWALTSNQILLSNDAGATWADAAANLIAGSGGLGTPGQILVSRSVPTVAYGQLGVGRSGSTIVRATPGGSWQPFFPEPSALLQHPYTLALDDHSGALYLSAPWLSQLWRIPNPQEGDPAAVRWEPLYTFGGEPDDVLNLLAAGWSPQGTALFVTFGTQPDGTVILRRSLDGGQSWTILTVP